MKKDTYFIDKNGQVLMRYVGPANWLEKQRPTAAVQNIDTATCGIAPANSYWDTSASAWTAIPDQPDEFHQWDWPSHSWIDSRTDEQKQLDADAAVEQAWADVRAQRNARLSATDWRVVRATEAGHELAPEWSSYRQALRDVTTQSDPYSIDWPVAPT